MLGPGKAVQGNLDPAALFAPPAELKRHVDAVLEEAGAAPGHIFNLGHGIWPDTDPDAVARLVDYVHERAHERRLCAITAPSRYFRDLQGRHLRGVRSLRAGRALRARAAGASPPATACRAAASRG